MKELRIIYDKGGLTHPDAEIMKWAEQLAENFNQGSRYYECFVSNATMVDAIRLLVATRVLNHEEVVFEYDDEVLRPNRYGMIERWPKGFCDIPGDILEKLLIASLNKRKEEKNGPKG